MTTVLHGHDESGTTAQRPGNADAGFKYFNTTTGELEVFDGTNWQVAPATKYANVAVSSEVENTITETAFDEKYTIPANTVKNGDVFRVRATAKVIDNNSTDTLTLRLRIGGVDIVATAAVDVADGDVGYFDAIVTIVSAGAASANVIASGVQALGVPGTVTAKPFVLSSAVVLNLVANGGDIDVTAEWSVAHADNEVRLEQLLVEKLSAAA